MIYFVKKWLHIPLFVLIGLSLYSITNDVFVIVNTLIGVISLLYLYNFSYWMIFSKSVWKKSGNNYVIVIDKKTHKTPHPLVVVYDENGNVCNVTIQVDPVSDSVGISTEKSFSGKVVIK